MHNSSPFSQIEKEPSLIQPGRVHTGLGKQPVTGRIIGAMLQLRRTITRTIG